MKAFPISVLLLTTSTLISLAPAQEWPRFRGPQGDGVNAAAKDLPAQFTPQDYTWKVELPGAGTSSPVLWGPKLFLTAEGAEAGSRAVLCFDAATGKQLWSHTDTFKPHGQHKFNNFASATPAVDGQQVYISWTSGEEMHVVALTHAGKKVWETNLGFYSEDHGSGASPVVVGKVLVVAKDHHLEGAFLTGLNVADGKTIWKLPRKTARSAFSTPLIVEPEKGKPVVIFNSNPNALTAVDPTNGKILWNRDYAETTEYRAVGSAAYCDGVYFTNVGQGTSGRSGAAVKLVKGKPETAWELPKAMPYVPTPLAFDGHFYVLNDGGILSCLKAATGAVVYSERVGDNAYSSPVCGGDKIYCISRAGKLTTVKVGEQFQILGKSDLGEPCESTPAIANGMIFIRTAKHLIAIGGKPAAASIYQGKGVDLQMVSEHQSIQPGQPLMVGFHLKHGPGWHTYWKNPGRAGFSFKIEWQLPEGWTAGDLEYAPPDKVMMAQTHTHGYEREVLHMVKLTPPAELPAGAVPLQVKAHWLCCATTCELGHCSLTLSLPVAATAPLPDPTWQPAFQAARAQQAQLNPEWTFRAQRVGDKIHLTATAAQLEKASSVALTPEPIFFSENQLICSDPAQQWKVEQGKLIGILPIADYAPKGTQPVVGLLQYEGKYLSVPEIEVAE